MPNKIAVVGYGSVGKALVAHLQKHEYVIDIIDPELDQFPEYEAYQTMHITIPYLSDTQYLAAFRTWVNRCKPKFIIIHSTLNPFILPMLTSEDAFVIAYAPIRNREQDMAKEMGTMQLFAAIIDPIQHIKAPQQLFFDYIDKNFDVVWFDDAKALAFGKLMETTWFGMNIAFCQMMKETCDHFGFNFDEAYTQYTEYSRIGKDYREDPLEYMTRPIFVPNVIGGKCVIQNLDIVDAFKLAYFQLIDFILYANSQTKRKVDHEETRL